MGSVQELVKGVLSREPAQSLSYPPRVEGAWVFVHQPLPVRLLRGLLPG